MLLWDSKLVRSLFRYSLMLGFPMVILTNNSCSLRSWQELAQIITRVFSQFGQEFSFLHACLTILHCILCLWCSYGILCLHTKSKHGDMFSFRIDLYVFLSAVATTFFILWWSRNRYWLLIVYKLIQGSIIPLLNFWCLSYCVLLFL